MHTTTSLLTALAGATIVLAGPAPAPPRPLVTVRPARPFPGQRIAARQDFTSTGDDASWTSCYHAYETLMAASPTPPAKVVEWMMTGDVPRVTLDADDLPNMTTFTSACDEAAAFTPPASLSSAWSSYTSAADSWADGQSSAVASLQSSCPGEVSAVVGMAFATDGPECTSAVLEYVSFVQSAAGITPAEPTATTTSVGAPEITGGAGDGNEDEDETAEDNEDETAEDNEDEGQDEGEGDDENPPTTTQSTAGVAAARETGLVAAVAAVAVGVAGVLAGF